MVRLIYKGKLLVLLAIAAVSQLVGCASVSKCPEQHLPEEQAAKVFAITNEHYYTNGKLVNLKIIAIDELPQCGEKLRPGHHRIQVETTWSNGWSDKTDLSVNAIPGNKYLISAFELRPGQDPASAIIRPKTFSEEMQHALLEGAATGAAPLLLPWIINDWLQKLWHPQQDSPFDGCCYVWIEDMETQELSDGKRPPGAFKIR